MKGKIVGTEFSKAKANGIQKGSEIIISHDPSNKYDNLALTVHFNDEHIGFIGKGTDLYDMPRDYFPQRGVVIDFYKKEDGDERYERHEVGNLVSCDIEVKDLVSLKKDDDVKSFNEEGVIINFNEESHTYTYQGKILKGATTYIKRYLKPFDSEFMIGRCSNAWGVDKEIIKNAWDLGRDLAAMFGSGVHKALEFEDLYRAYVKPKDGTRCFTIKNPAISDIVDGFFELYDKLGFQGEVVPEALVSDVENGICGLADRILVTDWENKRCRIQDYKVNADFDKNGKETIINLPKEIKLEGNKVSKLSLQLKFHEAMLKKSGWTVEGFDGFAYDGKWNYYEANELAGLNILTGKMEY